MKSKKIELRPTQDMGQGFFAKQPIGIGEQLLVVHTQTFISCNHYKDFHEFTDLKQCDKISNKVLFAYFLAAVSVTAQKKVDHRDIHEYFKVLPKQLHGLVCWSSQELEQLEDKQLVNIVKSKISSIENDFDFIRIQIRKAWQFQRENWQYRFFTQKQEIQLITLDQVLYFYSIIESRSVHFPCDLDSNSNVGALAPQLEFFNHSPHPQCSVQTGTYRYTVKACEEIKKDQQIFVSYGNFNESKVLEMYGFLQSLDKPIKEEQNYRRRVAQQYNIMYRKAKEK